MEDFRAIIFDFDGVLARTMEDNFEAWKKALSDYDLDLEPEHYYPLEGLSVRELPEVLFGKFGRKAPDPSEVARKKEENYLANHDFALYPGAKEIIERLRSHRIPIAVVTAAQAERLARSVRDGFLENFDVVITGNDTEHGKPAPDPYLKGAEKLGVSPEECLVIENAPLGIESAKAAGAYCIALCTTLDRRFLEGADEILNSVADVQDCELVVRLLTRSRTGS